MVIYLRDFVHLSRCYVVCTWTNGSYTFIPDHRSDPNSHSTRRRTMAFFLSNSTSSPLRSSTANKIHQDPHMESHRRFHIELGEREKALLADDPALKNFKSYKPTVRRIRKAGNVLTVVVAAACCYEIYQHAVARASEYKESHTA